MMRRLIAAAVFVALAFLGTGATTHAGTPFLVNTLGDAADANVGVGGCDSIPGGASNCTLRAAIQEANFDPATNPIAFDMPGAAPYNIAIMSPLPTITDSVILDATTDPEYAGTPVVVLNGAAAGAGVDGIRITAGESTVRGLAIHSFTQNGIKMETNGLNVIEANYVGTDFTGALDLGNGLNGIWAEDSDNNDIGTNGNGNLVSGNQSNGIALSGGATGNDIRDNYVGVNAAGTEDLGNAFGGIVLVGANANTVALNLISGNDGDGVSLSIGAAGNFVVGNLIGTDESGLLALGNDTGIEIDSGASGNFIGTGEGGARNVISGNTISNINIFDETSAGNMVQNNYIGPDIDGENELLPPTGPGNTGNGLQVFGAPGTVIGGAGVLGNLISGNPGTGIVLSQVSGTLVHNNFIGVKESGDTALPNGGYGVFVANDSSNNMIGGSRNTLGNVISGNLDSGVFLNNDAVNNVVEGNWIGTNEDGNAPIGNGVHGVAVFESQSNRIGSSEGLDRANVISANAINGVHFFGGTSTGNEVFGNLIGTEEDGESALGNGNNGVYFVNGASDNTVGGIEEGEGNLIAHNDGGGVIVDGATSTGNSVRGNSIHSNFELGIDNILGGNDELDPPVVTGFGSVSGTACSGCSVDVFSDSEDEGRTYEGTATANGSGDWTLDVFPLGPNVTATATDASGNTSEFSAPVEAPEPTPTPSPTASPTPTPTPTPEPSETPGPTPTGTPEPSGTPSGKATQGDTDCDEDVDTVDGLFVLRDVAGFPPSECIENGDVDCDEDRDSVDALGILRHVAGLPPLLQQEPCTDIGEPSLKRRV